MEGRRRITLLDQMSDVDGGRQSLAGLTLDDVLRLQKAPPQAPPLPPPNAASGQPVTRLLRNRTLIDMIQDDHSNKREKTPWKAFKDRLLNKRSSATWTSSVPTPISDISIPNKNKVSRPSFNKSSRKSSLRYVTPSSNSGRQVSPNMDHNYSPSAGDIPNSASSPQFSRTASTRINSIRTESTRFGDSFDPDASYVPDLPSHHNATHQLPTSDSMARERRITSRGVDPDAADYNDQTDSLEDRTLSAREAVQAQEAAEAAAAASAAEAAEAALADEGGGGGKMSLMDLLEEEGLNYMMDDDEDDEEYEDEGDEDEDHRVEEKEEPSVEYNCCVCMVRHKGAAFIPCGHAFCRLCSRELYASRENCPLCNQFIAEILDIF